MLKSFAAPSKYFQGRNVLDRLFSHIQYIGDRFLVLSDEIVLGLIEEPLKKGMEKLGGNCEFALFQGESTVEEAERIAKLACLYECKGIIGAGGGKVIDTSKYVANLLDIPVVIIPTAAASDAPCSAMSVVYDENGTFVISARMKRNPDVVIVDTEIIAKAPVRLLTAGMGDAFATYYEARACRASGVDNFTGGRQSEAGFALAELCNQLLLKYGAAARESVERREWSDALEKIVEANIYLSGVGFENNGCAIAHAFYSAATEVIHPFSAMHGEAVALGTIVQLEVEYIYAGMRKEEEWQEVTGFYRQVGLPLVFSDLGMDVMDDQQLERFAEVICRLPNAAKMPFQVRQQMMKQALLRVNK